jgi:hypothetical protein
VLLGYALRRCEAAALADGRSSGGFTPEAAVAARHANTPGLSIGEATEETALASLGKRAAKHLQNVASDMHHAGTVYKVDPSGQGESEGNPDQ